MPSRQELIEQFRVQPGKNFRLKDHDPSWAGDEDVPKAERKEFASKILTEDVTALAEAQELLYADDSWSLLVIFQAMDAAGKDSTIKHVMSGINPQGCQVYSFKHPSAEELDHDFLWRCTKALPERGRIGIFNRSYYEETLVVRVHPEFLAKQRMPRVDDDIWKRRFKEINNFERYLTDNGTVVLKFFLHLSKKEQKKRFLSRIDEPKKNWKFSPADYLERAHWDDYQHAFEDMLNHTSTEEAPWFVIPADNKWFARLAISEAICTVLDNLDLKYPTVDKARKEELLKIRAELEAE